MRGRGALGGGWGGDVYEASPAAREVFDEGDRGAGFALSRVVVEGPDEVLTRTVNAQPGLVMVELALVAAAREAAEQAGAALEVPAFVAGHSLGEYAALAAAGVCEVGTAIGLARVRGRLMQAASEQCPGSMAVVIGLGEEVVAGVCAESGAESGAVVANLNCPGQVAISGPKSAVRAARALARERGAKLVVPLAVSGAFHSPLMAPAVPGMREAVAGAGLRDPVVSLVGNTTASALTSAGQIESELVAQVTGCVRWAESVRLMVEAGVDTFVEFGPGSVLAGLIKRIAPGVRTITVNDVESVRGLVSVLAGEQEQGE